MLVYVWSRRNPFIRMNFFGLLNFQAPYLPWVLLGFSVILGNTIWVDLMGMAVGHIYYFLEDVFPNQRGGCKLLKTPQILWVSLKLSSTVNDFLIYFLDSFYSKKIFDEPQEHPDYTALPEDRPGGFNWGERQDQPDVPAPEVAADNAQAAAAPAADNNEDNPDPPQNH